jgi:hypothetical protein
MQQVIQWVVGHQAIVGSLVVGILDFIFAIIPSIDSNGVLHFIYLQAKKLVGQAPSP